jgi:hypothetical protein
MWNLGQESLKGGKAVGPKLREEDNIKMGIKKLEASK